MGRYRLSAMRNRAHWAGHRRVNLGGMAKRGDRAALMSAQAEDRIVVEYLYDDVIIVL
jgi:hypothetical protein